MRAVVGMAGVAIVAALAVLQFLLAAVAVGVVAYAVLELITNKSKELS